VHVVGLYHVCVITIHVSENVNFTVCFH